MKKKTIKWIICAVLSVMFIVILAQILLGQQLFIDKFIVGKVLLLRNDYNTNLFKFITILGSKEFIILSMLIVCVVLYLKKRKGSSFALLINMVNITILNEIIKHLVRRARPVGGLVVEDGFSFPSGHSMMSMGFYGFLIFLVYRSNLKKEYKEIIIVALSSLIFMIGCSRIYLGVHYPSDVIGGFILSVIYLIIYSSIVGKRLKKH